MAAHLLMGNQGIGIIFRNENELPERPEHVGQLQI